ncbi:MAG: sodium:proline symporter, partial [Anaerobacillus sp.]
GYFGQPHIITRFMAVKSSKEIPKARLVGMTWMVISLFGAIFTGFIGIAYFAAGGPLDNPETIFIEFTQVLFNPWVSGFLLAAILSAIMSTIDSQLLVSSSAVAEDFYKAILRKNASQTELVWVGRIAVLAIALLAILLAYNPDSSVLNLVSYAWAGFGAAFGPVIILSLFWKRMTRNGALAGIITGAVIVILWSQLSGGLFDLYELIPGFILAWIAVMVFSFVGKEPGAEIEAEFEEARVSKL